MNRFMLTISLLVLPGSVWAHHTQDHLVLGKDIGQVIAATHQGATGSWFWLLWTGVLTMALVGFIRWWQHRDKS